MDEILKKIRESIEGPINEIGYILDDVVYVKEGQTYFLRIIVDNNAIMTVEDCVKVTHVVDPIIDELDLIDNSYVLDVCSKEKGWD